MSPAASTPNREIAQDSYPTKVSCTGQHYFFGIGINTYAHFSRLHNATRDVKGVAEVLHQRYQFQKRNIVLLLDEDATRDNIICQLDAYQEMLSPKDRLLIYYSGHGHLNQKTERGYWIPVDGVHNKTATYINNAIIKNYMEDIPSKHILLISDSCFSGALFVRGETRSSLAIEELEQRPSRWAFCSGRHDELVYDGKPGTNSPFSGSIIKVLKRNRNPKINLMKLIDEVIELTRAQYKQLPEGNPLFNAGHEGGQFIFQLQNGETLAWANCQKVNSVDAYQLFLHKYPKGKYATDAKKNLENLEAIELAKLQQTILQTSHFPNIAPDTTLQMTSNSRPIPQLKKLEEQAFALQKKLMVRDTLNRIMGGILLIALLTFGVQQLILAYQHTDFQPIQDPNGLLMGLIDTSEENCFDSLFYDAAEEELIHPTPSANKAYGFDYRVEENTLMVTIKKAKPNNRLHLIKKGQVVYSSQVDSTSIFRIDLTEFQQQPGTYALQLVASDTTPISKTIIIHPGKEKLNYGDQTYHIITFGGLTWMADNLNIVVEGSSPYPDSVTYHNAFGLFYNKKAAETACVKLGEGWRLPTDKEIQQLARWYGGMEDEATDGGMAAYKGLTDPSGFQAQLGGWLSKDSTFQQINMKGAYWTRTNKGKKDAHIYTFSYGKMGLMHARKDMGFSCRCVRKAN